jgi:hypothetical protein
MFLLVGEPDDALIAGVSRALHDEGRRVIALSETELYTCGLELHRIGTELSGALYLNGSQPCRFNEIAGVLLRPRRQWWPDPAFDFADAIFVYHETMAAWLAVLKSLVGRVVNDFGLGWWLGDPVYAETLRLELADALGLDREPMWAAAAAPGPAGSQVSAAPAPLASVVVAGDVVVPCGGEADGVSAWLGGEDARNRLAAWQRATGIHFARIDLAAARPEAGAAILAVDPLPAVPSGGASLERLCRGLAGALLAEGRA